MTNPDQLSYDTGYADGLTGSLPNHESDACLLQRFEYIAGWGKGYREWAASREEREVIWW